MHTEEPTPLPPFKKLPQSKHGDKVHIFCSVIIDWLIENGDPDMKASAIHARAYWEDDQDWIIQWANAVRYFPLAEAACRDLAAFRHAIETLPPETDMQMDYYIDGQEEPKKVDVVVWLALQAGKRYKRSIQPRGKRIGGK